MSDPVIVKKRYEPRHPWLGRHVNHDSRSSKFPFPVEGLTVQSVVHSRHIPILDQGPVGSCTADAGIGALGTKPLFGSKSSDPYTLDQAGAYALYSAEEVLDGDGPYPPQDNGSSGLTCARVLKAAGIINSYQHVFDANSALKALSVTPFLFGTDWTNQMFNPDPDGRVHPQGSVAGGHEILCREYDAPNERLWFDNSWGSAWGVAGRFYLTLTDFTDLLKRDGDVTILIPVLIITGDTRRRRHHHHHKV